ASQRSWMDPPPGSPIVRTAPTPEPSTVQLSSIPPPHLATPPKSPSSSQTFAAGAATGSLTFTSDIGLPSSAPDTICGLRVGDASGPSPRVDPNQAGTDLE